MDVDKDQANKGTAAQAKLFPHRKSNKEGKRNMTLCSMLSAACIRITLIAKKV